MAASWPHAVGSFPLEPPAALAQAIRAIDGQAVAHQAREIAMAAAEQPPERVADTVRDRFRSVGVRSRVDLRARSAVVLAELGGAQGPIYTIQWHGHLAQPRTSALATRTHRGSCAEPGVRGVAGALAAMIAAAQALATSDCVGRTQRVLITIQGEMERPLEVLDAMVRRNYYGDAVLSTCTCDVGGPAAPTIGPGTLPASWPGTGRWEVRVASTTDQPAGPKRRSLEMGVLLLDRLQATAARLERVIGHAGLWLDDVRLDHVNGDCVGTGGYRGEDDAEVARIGEGLDRMADELRQVPGLDARVVVALTTAARALATASPLVDALRAACRAVGRVEPSPVTVDDPGHLGRFPSSIAVTSHGLAPSSAAVTADTHELAEFARVYALASWAYLRAVTP